jgi:hypothetical protein
MCRLVLWAILTLIFMSYRCHGCKLICKTSSGLNRHISNCVQAGSVISLAAQQRQTVKLREEAAKIARTTKADVSEERQLVLAAMAEFAVRCLIIHDLSKTIVS